MAVIVMQGESKYYPSVQVNDRTELFHAAMQSACIQKRLRRSLHDGSLGWPHQFEYRLTGECIRYI